jgi:hypothetical protein
LQGWQALIALGLTFGLVVLWLVVGYLAIFFLDRDAEPTRNLLLAPTIGFSIIMVPVFTISRLGISIEEFGIPLLIMTCLIAGGSWYRLRPPLPVRQYLPFLLILILAVLITGKPMLSLGFDWLSYGNDDMTNYVLRATRLLHNGYFHIPGAEELVKGTDYSSYWWFFDVIFGIRAGVDITLAWVMSVTGLSGHRAYMPLMLAFHFSLVSAAAALCYESKRDAFAALLVCVLVALSAETSLGTLYQLLGQVPGVAVLLAALAIFSRGLKTTFRDRATAIRYGVLAGFILASEMLTYPELLPVLGLATALLLGVSFLRRRQDLLNKQRIAAGVVASISVVVIVNIFILDAIQFMLTQAGAGATSTDIYGIHFPTFLLPSGLSVLWGFTTYPALGTESSLAILAGAVLLAIAVIGSVYFTWQERPFGPVVIVMIGLAITLFAKTGDFGLFKLSMYAQPFLLATLTFVWLALVRNRNLIIMATPLLILAAAGIHAQRGYIVSSQGNAARLVEVRRASNLAIAANVEELLKKQKPDSIIIDSPNIVLQKIIVAYTRGIPTAVVSRNALVSAAATVEKYGTSSLYFDRASALALQVRDLVESREFDMQEPNGAEEVNGFSQIQIGREEAAKKQDPTWVVIDPSASLLNPRELAPYGKVPIVGIPQSKLRNHLVFIDSKLGQHYYGFADPDKRTIYQAEIDWFQPNSTFTAIGRYWLMEVVNPSDTVRLELSITAGLKNDRSNLLPPAEAIGTQRESFPLAGRGSAHVFSPPVKVQKIGGLSYVMMDMGVDGQPPKQPPRSGLATLYGKNVLVDNRRFIGFSRGISMVSEQEYASLDAPTKVQKFPNDLLNNRDLEYSGMFEDGWVSEAVLLGLKSLPDQTQFVVEGGVPLTGDPNFSTQAQILIDGVTVHTQVLSVGSFSMKVPFSGRTGRHSVEIRFSHIQNLPGEDGRPVAAIASYIGFD